MFRIVIPARYASVRLPGKPLRLIAGRPMIEHVHARAVLAGATEVIIATDDERVATACRAFGAAVALTDPRHPSGTDRLAEVAAARGWPADAIVVNVQGDEPLVPPANVAQVAALLAAEPAAALATLATPIVSLAELEDPNLVKLVMDRAGRALYFSRAPIPWQRDAASATNPAAARIAGAWRHIGLYAYRVSTLERLASLTPTPLELAERLEQLRALEHGLPIAVAAALAIPGPGVDTEADLAVVEGLIRSALGR
ncbi:MAG TPA: 3-deoxy-manno-octulosonate cytidylyltransferase [Steroidobacteraceae bacterium]|nr:3-deoxy-manno-octulosonate cytidylyltransferase [Steroidobacteraceae bacterium]